MNKAFEDDMKKTFSARLLDLSLRGSFSRGEEREDSDMDYHILLDRIDAEDLVVIKDLAVSYSISPFLSSKDEFKRLSGAARFQFFCENKELFDRFGVPPPESKDGWELIKRNFEDALHACRHYLLEPHLPSRIIQRIFYSIKTIDFSLRAYMLLKTNFYPGTRKALKSFIADIPEALWILDVLETWDEKKREYEMNLDEFLLRLDANLRGLLARVLP
jgi:hypothetical protein